MFARKETGMVKEDPRIALKSNAGLTCARER